MSNNNQSEEVERIVGEELADFKKRFEHAFTGFLFADVSIWINNTIRQNLATHGASEYARGKSEEREKVIDEIFLHVGKDVARELEEALSLKNTLKE